MAMKEAMARMTAAGAPSQLTISRPFTPRMADWAQMATTMMAVSHTGRGHHLKLVRIISAKVFAFTAIQLTADRAISTDMMAELRLPRKLRARTSVVLPLFAPMMPTMTATNARIALPTTIDHTVPLKLILEPTVAPVTKLEREMQ